MAAWLAWGAGKLTAAVYCPGAGGTGGLVAAAQSRAAGLQAWLHLYPEPNDAGLTTFCLLKKANLARSPLAALCFSAWDEIKWTLPWAAQPGQVHTAGPAVTVPKS